MELNIFQKLYHKDLNKAYRSFSDGGGKIILDNVIGEIPDLQNYFENLHKEISPGTKILISYHNPRWEPVLALASVLGLRKKVGVQNWLDREDLQNILSITSFRIVSTKIRFFGITLITIAQSIHKTPSPSHAYSISLIVPARNEQENIPNIVSSIPKFGKSQEIIFIEGGSSDQTWSEINKQVAKYKSQTTKHKSSTINHKSLRVRAFKQRGNGKADAVRLGFEKAKGDIIMIYDADRTVPARDLPKFYNVLARGIGEFANGSRLVYPMESQAMQRLNKFGNLVFSSIFTKIFGQHFKDTLCGTKALFRTDFLKMKKDYLKYLKIDPFGDFALIFSAVKHNLKVVEIPVRYKEREYGSTNISRFYHGLLLIKLSWIAYKEFKL